MRILDNICQKTPEQPPRFGENGCRGRYSKIGRIQANFGGRGNCFDGWRERRLS